MPGGDDFRRWYAMRKAMQERGTWKGKEGQPTHKVPSLDLEAGEPRPKVPKPGPIFGIVAQPTPDASPDTAIPPSRASTVPDSLPGTPDSLPALESPATAEGKRNYGLFFWLFMHFFRKRNFNYVRKFTWPS